MNIYDKTIGTKEWKIFFKTWHQKNIAYCHNNGFFNEDETIYMLSAQLEQAEEKIKELQTLTKHKYL